MECGVLCFMAQLSESIKNVTLQRFEMKTTGANKANTTETKILRADYQR